MALNKGIPIDLPDDPGVWQLQLPKESAPGFAAYAIFRDLGPTRTLLETARRNYEKPTLEKNTGKYRYVQEWSRIFHWFERARQHDAEVDSMTRLEQIEAVKAMRARHAALASNVLAKAVERLQTLKADDLSARDLLAFLEVASKVERLARGEPDQITELTGSGGGPIQLEGLGLDRQRLVELLGRDLPDLDDDD